MNIAEAVYTIKTIFPNVSIHYVDGSTVATITILDNYINIAYLIQQTSDKLIFNTAQYNYDKFSEILNLFNVSIVAQTVAEINVELT